MLLQLKNDNDDVNMQILKTVLPRNIENVEIKHFKMNYVLYGISDEKKCNFDEINPFIADCKNFNHSDQKFNKLTKKFNYSEINTIFTDLKKYKICLLHSLNKNFENLDFIDFLNNSNSINFDEKYFKSLFCIMLSFDVIHEIKFITNLEKNILQLNNKTSFELYTWTNIQRLNILKKNQANFVLLDKKKYEITQPCLYTSKYVANLLFFDFNIKYEFIERGKIIEHFKKINLIIWRIFEIELESKYTCNLKIIVIVFWKKTDSKTETNDKFLIDEHMYFIQKKNGYYKIIEKIIIPFYIP